MVCDLTSKIFPSDVSDCCEEKALHYVAQIKNLAADFEREQLGRGGACSEVSISQRQEMIAANVFVS
jgi:hypothetical protein